MVEQEGFKVGDRIIMLSDPERRVGKIVGFDRDTYSENHDTMNVAYNDTVSIPIPRYKWDYARKVNESGETLPRQ